MKTMEYVMVDILSPGQLEVMDIIKIDGEYVQILTISDDATGDIYQITYENEFGEKGLSELSYFDSIELFLLM